MKFNNKKEIAWIKPNLYCKVTNCSPNPKEIGNGNGPNKPNTINL